MAHVPLILTALILLRTEPSSPARACTCAATKTSNGWCGGCDIGYVAGVQIKSRELFEAIDAHGHQVDPNSYRCESCREALATDGFCGACKTGFVRKEAYFSKLTYYLAKGSARDPSEIKCSACRENSAHQGWCDACGVGMVGRFAFTDRADFEAASKAQRVLIRAIELAAKCEICAIAMAVDRSCYRCNISYEDGEKSDESAGR